MKAKIGIALSALALAALTACGSTAGPGGIYNTPGGSSSSDSATGEPHTASTSLGTIVVNGAGMTVYFFDHDKPNETASTCTGACLALWPAVITASATPTISGVTGTVGTITGTDGAKQVTLNGLPLYTYAADKEAGDTSGQGFGGIWWVVDANGAKVTSAPAQVGSGY